MINSYIEPITLKKNYTHSILNSQGILVDIPNIVYDNKVITYYDNKHRHLVKIVNNGVHWLKYRNLRLPTQSRQ